jgi:hypothetical protein
LPPPFSLCVPVVPSSSSPHAAIATLRATARPPATILRIIGAPL